MRAKPLPLNALVRSAAGTLLVLGGAWLASCGGEDATAGPTGNVVGNPDASSGGNSGPGGSTGTASSGGSGGSLVVDSGPTGDAPASDAKPVAVNLIPNGDFSQGNTLFGSDYAYATSNTAEGQYTVPDSR